MRNHKKAFYANICIFILEVFAIGWMMSGFNNGVFSGARLSALRYFTVDSNILMGIVALVAAIQEGKVIKGKREEKGKREDLSSGVYTLKLAGTVGVTLTMLVTAFFLAPKSATGYFSLFYYSNFFLHLVNPLLSIITFLFLEKTDKIPFKNTLTGIIPMVLYAVYYVEEAVTHSTNGIIAKGYDWYGFFYDGIRSGVVVLPLMVLITYLISLVLWKLNRYRCSYNIKKVV